MNIFASVDPANLPTRDEEPYRFEGGTDRISAEEHDAPGSAIALYTLYDPRPPATTHPHNPILSALRDCETGRPDVEIVRRWVDALDEPGVAPEVDAVLNDVYGTPAGPGWEDNHWDWSLAITKHARAVLMRLWRMKMGYR